MTDESAFFLNLASSRFFGILDFCCHAWRRIRLSGKELRLRSKTMRSIINTRARIVLMSVPLLVAACVSTQREPSRDREATATAHDHATPMADSYTCPMHPQIVKDAPGRCPICGMNLVKKESPSPHGTTHG